MRGEHERLKLEAVVRAAGKDEVHNGAVMRLKVEDLCRSICIDVGMIVLPWRWNDVATEVLRRYGCVLRTTGSKGSVAPTQRQTSSMQSKPVHKRAESFLQWQRQ